MMKSTINYSIAIFVCIPSEDFEAFTFEWLYPYSMSELEPSSAFNKFQCESEKFWIPK